jgi:tetratricopeptide (TPR) repeat protein
MNGPAARPTPAATGTLAKTPVVNLLLYAHERKLTGTIELTAGSTSAAIVFRGGRAAKGRTKDPVAYLGRVVLELGFIDDAKLDHALAEMALKKRLIGRILVEMGAISEAQLLSALGEQLIRRIRWMAHLPPEGTFAYYDAVDLLSAYGGPETVALDPLPLVASAIHEAPSWDHVHAALARLAASPLRLSRQAEISRFDLDERERQFLDVLRAQPLRVSELIASAVLNPRDAQLLLYTLVMTKQITVAGADSLPPPANSLAMKAAAPLSPPPPTTGSTPPRRISSPSPSPSPPARTTPSPPARNTPAPLAPITPPALLTGELAQRKKDIVERAKFIDREDYFQMLDLDRTSTVDQARNAFLSLAKTWHPDKLPAVLADVKGECSRVFARLSEAHTTLVDEKRRANYMKLLTEGGATPEAQATIIAVIEASTNFQKAEVHVRRNDFVQAEALCRKAVEADPGQPDYLALLAWLEAMKPEAQTPLATQMAIAKLGKAIEMSNKCERAYFYRGQLNKRLGNVAAAMRDFRHAADLNPRNLDAVREVRLHEMRSQRGTLPPKGAPKGERESNNPPTPDKGGGLFGKLFKK